MAAPQLPTTTRQVHLASRPTGRLTTGHLRLVEVPLRGPEPGEVVVRNSHLALGAVMRERMERDADLPPALAPYEVGGPLRGHAVGTVVASARDGVPVGTTVVHDSPWAELAPTAHAVPVPEDALPAPWYHLATGSGATALLGVRDVARVGDGDVVLVSGAAGGVGSLAGQIARRLGAARVIGTAGSAAKCDWLVSELGYDAAVDHHTPDLVGELRRAAPDGVDVYVDLVGGTQFEAAVQVAATHARFAVGGALATQQGGAAWPRFDTQTAMLKDLTVRGYALAHGRHVMGEWPALFGRWLAEGMVFPHTVVPGGLDAAPQAMVDLLRGAFTGSVFVAL